MSSDWPPLEGGRGATAEQLRLFADPLPQFVRTVSSDDRRAVLTSVGRAVDLDARSIVDALTSDLARDAIDDVAILLCQVGP